jgi:biuret amidohydrolase
VSRESSRPDVDPANDYVAVFTPQGMELDPARTCLVVVDVMYATGSRDTGLGKRLAAQGKLEEARYRYDRIEQYVIPNSRRLLDFCREHDVRRVFLTYGSEVSDYSDLSDQVRALCEHTNNRVGEREHEILDEFKPRPNERVFNKITPCAFTSTPIELVLHTYGIKTLLFAGVSTNMCVEHSLRDAADRGFHCILVEDACGADSQAMHDSAVSVVPRLYGGVMTTDEVLERIGAAVAAEVAT